MNIKLGEDFFSHTQVVQLRRTEDSIIFKLITGEEKKVNFGFMPWWLFSDVKRRYFEKGETVDFDSLVRSYNNLKEKVFEELLSELRSITESSVRAAEESRIKKEEKRKRELKIKELERKIERLRNSDDDYNQDGIMSLESELFELQYEDEWPEPCYFVHKDIVNGLTLHQHFANKEESEISSSLELYTPNGSLSFEIRKGFTFQYLEALAILVCSNDVDKLESLHFRGSRNIDTYNFRNQDIKYYCKKIYSY